MEKNVSNKSFAMELLEYSKVQNEQLEKKNNKRLFVMLIIVTILWFATIVGGIYYITHYGTETEITTADTSDGGNACDGCYKECRRRHNKLM